MAPPLPRQKQRTRVLLVEDTPERHTWFTAQLASLPDLHLVWVRTGPAALTLLSKDAPDTYAGVLLDHTLHTTDPLFLGNGRNVVSALIEHVDPSTPVFVHSNNTQWAPVMADKLRTARFDVQQVFYDDLKKDPAPLAPWIEKVRQRRAELDEEAEG